MSSVPDPLVSARERGGRRFQPVRERSLEGVALEACASLPGAQAGLVVIKEVAGPYGIPDLVAVVGDPKVARERLALGVPPLLNELDAAIVATTAPRARLEASRRWHDGSGGTHTRFGPSCPGSSRSVPSQRPHLA